VNVFSAPWTSRAVLGRPTMMPNALPVYFGNRDGGTLRQTPALKSMNSAQPHKDNRR
jgi:hypothetical protein